MTSLVSSTNNVNTIRPHFGAMSLEELLNIRAIEIIASRLNVNKERWNIDWTKLSENPVQFRIVFKDSIYGLFIEYTQITLDVETGYWIELTLIDNRTDEVIIEPAFGYEYKNRLRHHSLLEKHVANLVHMIRGDGLTEPTGTDQRLMTLAGVMYRYHTRPIIPNTQDLTRRELKLERGEWYQHKEDTKYYIHQWLNGHNIRSGLNLTFEDDRIHMKEDFCNQTMLLTYPEYEDLKETIGSGPSEPVLIMAEKKQVVELP